MFASASHIPGRFFSWSECKFAGGKNIAGVWFELFYIWSVSLMFKFKAAYSKGLVFGWKTFWQDSRWWMNVGLKLWPGKNLLLFVPWKKNKNMMWRICFIPKEGRKRPKSFAAIRDTVVLYKAPKVTHVSSTCVKVLKHLKWNEPWQNMFLSI